MRRPHQHGYRIPERPCDIRIRFDDYGVSAEARAVVLDFHALSPEHTSRPSATLRSRAPGQGSRRTDGQPVRVRNCRR